MIDTISIKADARRQLLGNIGLLLPAIIISKILGNLNLLNELLIQLNIEIPYLLSKSMEILGFLIGGVMMFGVSRISLKVIKKEGAKFTDLFSGLSIYLKVLALYTIMTVLTIIGLSVFIVPGIVISLALSQAFYILAEDEDESVINCLIKSEKMMRGHKKELFLLELSFLGWIIIIILTLGMALIWLEPYMEMTFANYYLKIKKEESKQNIDKNKLL